MSNVAIVESIYAELAKGDLPSVLAHFDADIEWNEAEGFPYADRNPYRGPDAVAEGLLARLGSEWDYWKVEPERFVDGGDTVVALGRYKAKNAQTAKEVDAQFAHVWGFSNGKVVRFQQYADTKQVSDAVS